MHTALCWNNLFPVTPESVLMAQAIAEIVVDLARRDHLGAVRELADRAEGRAAPAVSVDESLNEFADEDEVSDSSKADPDEDGNPRVN